MSNLSRAHIIVRGRVQGVGFRWFVQREAENLGLFGSVKNMVNGDVEVYVEGEKVAIESLLDSLNKGNAISRVVGCDCAWQSYTGDFSKFNIIF